MSEVKLYEFPPMLGPCEDFSAGSKEWAERLGCRIQAHMRDIGYYGVDTVRKSVNQAIDAVPPPWEVWPDKPCGSVDAFFKLCCGKTFEQIYALIDAYHEDHDLARKLGTAKAKTDGERISQGTRTDLGELPYHIRMSDKGKDGGTSESYLLRRLAKQAPETLAAYERGEFPSVRSAAKAAGIVKDRTHKDKLASEWGLASETERREFMAQVGICLMIEGDARIDQAWSVWQQMTQIERKAFAGMCKMFYDSTPESSQDKTAKIIQFPKQNTLDL